MSILISTSREMAKAYCNRDGWMCVDLPTQDGQIEQMFIHELACIAFHGPRPTPNSVAVIIDADEYPSAENVGWLTQHPESSFDNNDTQIRVAIDEAIQQLVYDGLVVDSGDKRWSERTRTYETLWTLTDLGRLH